MPYSLGGVTIRNPDRGWSAKRERIGAVHQTLAGGRVVDTLGMLRTFGFSWTALTAAEYAALDARFTYVLPQTLVMADGTTATVQFESLVPTVRLTGVIDAAAVLLEI